MITGQDFLYHSWNPQWGPKAKGSLLRVLFLLGCFRLYTSNSLSLKRPHIVFIIADDLLLDFCINLDDMEIIISNKDKEKLLLAGYAYLVHTTGKLSIRWRCIKQKLEKGWNDVSFHGSMQIPTPNVDAIAKDGIILNQYYVQPICSPSRGSLMTGKYPIRIGFQHNVILPSSPWGLPLTENILPEYLKALGYSTHAFGKWHLGFFKKEYLPNERGFDSFFGYYNGMEDYFTHVSKEFDVEGLDLHDNAKNVWQYNGTYGPDLFTLKARRVILEHNPNEPLFLYFAQQSPHSGNFHGKPLQAPEKYVRDMVGITDEKRKLFAGMVSSMDHSVGDIFEALEIAGMLDDTIFVFTTDNGGAPQEAVDRTSGSNWPLKGCKQTLWEGGVRGVSFIWSSFLRQHRGVYDGLMHISDWLPTILSAVGGHEALKMLPENIDGVNQWPSILYGFPSPRSEILLNLDEKDKVAGIRKGRFKLVKGNYLDGKYDKWYDKEGGNYSISHSPRTQLNERCYWKNYLKLYERSKSVRLLWYKYNKDPGLSISCLSYACKDFLKVDCGVPPPLAPTCNSKKESCLYDVISDPCEYYNIAPQFPELTAEMEKAIEKYKAVSVPPKDLPKDPAANPKLHGNAWKPWK